MLVLLARLHSRRVTAGLTSGAPGANVIAATATATVNLRVMVGETAASTVDRVRRIVKDDRVQVSVLSGSDPSAVAPIDDAFALLERVLAATMRDVVAVPYIAMAATDSRYFHRRWPRVYRFNPFRMSRAQPVRCTTSTSGSGCPTTSRASAGTPP